MELNRLMLELLSLLLEADGRIDQRDAAESLQCSRRALNYHLEKVSSWLRENGLPAVQAQGDTLLLESGCLPELRRLLETRSQNEYLLSRGERAAFTVLAAALSPQPVTIEWLRAAFDVSRNTVVNELGELKHALSAQQLVLCSTGRGGYELQGSEQEIRYRVMTALFYCLAGGASERAMQLIYDAAAACSGRPFGAEEQHRLEQLVQPAEEALDTRFGASSLQEIALYLLMIVLRNGKGGVCRLPEKEFPAQKLAAGQAVLTRAAAMGLRADAQESVYFTAVILGSKIYDTLGPIREDTDEYRLTRQLIDAFEARACVTFANKQQLTERLLLHIRPMLFRYRYRIKVRNISTREVKQKYKNLFLAADAVVQQVAPAYGIEVDEDEAAFLAMYLGGFLEEAYPSDCGGRQILLVCGFGQGTSLLVKQQAEQLLGAPARYTIKDERQFSPQDYRSYDLVLSTLPLPSDAKLIRVSPVLTRVQQQKLLEWDLRSRQAAGGVSKPQQVLSIVRQYAHIENESGLYQQLLEYFAAGEAPRPQQPTLAQVLRREYVHIETGTPDYETAIRGACAPLVRAGVIGSGYADSVLEIMRRYGLYFELQDGILLGHAKPGSRVSSVALTLSLYRTPLDFAPWGKKIRIIFMLATPDNKAHHTLLQDLLRLIQNEESRRRLLACDFADEEELYRYIIARMVE